MKRIYLDNAATTPMHPEVVDEITNIMKNDFGNPSSTHQFGRSARGLVENTRKEIATHFNVSPTEIVFTAGGSEADNLIIKNAICNLKIKRIVMSTIEHHAVLHTVEDLAEEYDVKVEFAELDENGFIKLDLLAAQLENGPKTLVCLMHINNEIGNILDIAKVCEICNNNDAFFHSDTVQTIGHYTLDLQQTPIDFVTCSAHKFHGPKGVGFAIIKKGFGIKPLLTGGEQERGARAGTENVPNIVGMGKALSLALVDLKIDQDHVRMLKTVLMTGLKEIDQDLVFNGGSGDLTRSTYTVLNVRFSKPFPMLLFQLDLKGLAVSGGSACQSGSSKGSHVLNAILKGAETEKTSVRFSMSKFTTIDDIHGALEIVKSVIG